MDYQDTFATVAKMINLNWTLQQFDVKTTFLHGDLGYMDVPLGLDTKQGQIRYADLNNHSMDSNNLHVLGWEYLGGQW